jgi:DNA-binding response OmpR family regulator
MAKILIVEDDVKYAGLITDYLAAQTHTIDMAATVQDARAYLDAYQYEVLIVDWNLPDGEGPALVQTLRKQGHNVPVLMLTSRDTMDDKERGFCAGVDDYLVKDAHPRELGLRVTSLLRRPATFQDTRMKFRDIEIDQNTHSVTKAGVSVHLLPKEFALLAFLMRYPGKLFSGEELLLRLWPSDTEATTQTVRSGVNKLRMKLDSPGQPSIIVTKHKAGYMLNVHSEATV